MCSSCREISTRHCNLNTLPFVRLDGGPCFCYYITEITAWPLLSPALQRRRALDRQKDTRGKGGTLVWICKVTAQVMQTSLWQPKEERCRKAGLPSCSYLC